jgi:acyl carrier protein phosphodiesterase
VTKTEQELQRIGEVLAALNERTAAIQSDIDALWKDLERRETAFEKLRGQIAAQQIQIAVLQASFAELTERWDESDRRRWTVYGVMLAAALTFVANLVLLFLKR